jgi:hypothetical protein
MTNERQIIRWVIAVVALLVVLPGATMLILVASGTPAGVGIMTFMSSMMDAMRTTASMRVTGVSMIAASMALLVSVVLCIRRMAHHM